jgi:hypothetical protein
VEKPRSADHKMLRQASKNANSKARCGRDARAPLFFHAEFLRPSGNPARHRAVKHALILDEPPLSGKASPTFGSCRPSGKKWIHPWGESRMFDNFAPIVPAVANCR